MKKLSTKEFWLRKHSFREVSLIEQKRAVMKLAKRLDKSGHIKTLCSKLLLSNPVEFKKTSPYYFRITWEMNRKPGEDLVKKFQRKMKALKKTLSMKNSKSEEIRKEARILRALNLAEKAGWVFVPDAPDCHVDPDTPRIIRLSKNTFEIRAGVEVLHGPGSFEEMQDLLGVTPAANVIPLQEYRDHGEIGYVLHTELPDVEYCGIVEGRILEDGEPGGLWYNGYKFRTTAPLKIHVFPTMLRVA